MCGIGVQNDLTEQATVRPNRISWGVVSFVVESKSQQYVTPPFAHVDQISHIFLAERIGFI